MPKLVRATDGRVVEGMQVEIAKASGEVMKGQSSAAGIGDDLFDTRSRRTISRNETGSRMCRRWMMPDIIG
ncbi:hypothetical protein GQ57_02700 [Burkholderia sp. MSh2]|uniref:hypothetical protein n=1 Tax=Burkholderia TaxID=32008 RepID=UPI0004D428BE|nr:MULTISPECIES: hypothetical protein [Burkholderia]KEZ07102.1 hypothetical protein GQ57_02700 [Burkholderia sp. MSh2]